MIDYTLDVAPAARRARRLPDHHHRPLARRLDRAAVHRHVSGPREEGRRDRGARPAARSMIREQPPAHERMREWIGEMQSLARRHPHRYTTLDEAVARMREANPASHRRAGAPSDGARLLPRRGRHVPLEVRQLRARGLALSLQHARGARDSGSAITCPVLLLRGTESWASDPEKDGRATAFRDYASSTSTRRGHWVHHDQLEIFLRTVREFLVL